MENFIAHNVAKRPSPLKSGWVTSKYRKGNKKVNAFYMRMKHKLIILNKKKITKRVSFNRPSKLFGSLISEKHVTKHNQKFKESCTCKTKKLVNETSFRPFQVSASSTTFQIVKTSKIPRPYQPN